jgi:hypothetical protein
MTNESTIQHIDISALRSESVVYLERLDAEIALRHEHLAVLQACRANVAKTFGIDRRLDPTPVEKLVDGANRRIFEGASAQPTEEPEGEIDLSDALEEGLAGKIFKRGRR